MKYELSDSVVQNLLVFLDRVQFQGLKEYQALQDILKALSKSNEGENEG